MELSLAPLQTYTDYHFRNALHEVYGSHGIKYYAPYLKLNNDGTIKPNTKIDILPENNRIPNLIPQLMACNVDDFFVMANYIESLGYNELNWNMGCPYPMVTNRGLGAGILNQPKELEKLLTQILPKLNLKLGIKMRMGMESTAEILDLLPMLNQFPLTEIIIHGRYAKQLYEGTPDYDRFAECVGLCKHPLVFNGDIDSSEKIKEVKTLFPTISGIMIGRNAVKNPAIFHEFLTGQFLDSTSYRTKLLHFSKNIEASLLACNKHEGYALSRLISFWEYFCEELSEGKHLFRKLKKARSVEEFNEYLKILH